MTDSKKSPIEIGAREILMIKSMAHNDLINKAIPKNAAVDLRTFYLLNALHDYLVSRGIDPGFKVQR